MPNNDNSNKTWFSNWTERTGLQNVAHTVMDTIKNTSHHLLSQAEETKITEYLKEATQQTEATNYQKALDYINSALAIQPDLSVTLHAASKVYLAANTYLDDAEQLALSAIQNTSSTLEKVEYYKTLNDVYHQQNEYDKAIAANLEALAQLATAAPNEQTTDMRLTHLEHLSHNYTYHTDTPEKAIPYLQEAIKITPEDFDLCYNMGKVHQLENQYTSAIEWYNKALNLIETAQFEADKLPKEKAFILCDIGICYIGLERHERAGDCLHQAHQLDHQLGKATVHLAALAAHYGQAEEMEQYLQTAIQHATPEQWIQKDYNKYLIEAITPYPAYKRQLIEILWQHQKIPKFTYKVHQDDATQQALAEKTTVQKELKNLVRQDELDTVLDNLIEFVAIIEDKTLMNQAIALNGRYANNERVNHLGVIDAKDYQLELNKLRLALLNLIDNL